MGVGGQHHTRPLYPRERRGTNCIGGWVGPGDSLDGCGKSHPPPGFNQRTIQPVESRYTKCAFLAHTLAGQAYLIILHTGCQYVVTSKAEGGGEHMVSNWQLYQTLIQTSHGTIQRLF